MATNSILGTLCELCSRHFSDPRLLPCLHSFCYECLVKHFDANKSGYSCPTCKEAFEVPDGKIEMLPNDFYGSYVAEVTEFEEKINHQSDVNCDRCIVSSESVAVKFCCNCSKFLCSWCTKDHTRRQKTHKHELVDVGEKKEDQQAKSLINNIPRRVMNCQLHSDEVLKFYCTTCSCLICRDCMALSHSSHTYDRIEATAKKEKDDLLMSVSEGVTAVKKLEDAMAKGEKVIQNIKARQHSVDDEIKDCFKDLHEALRRREECLLARSSEISLTKITALMLQIEDMKKIYNEITRVSGYIKEAADTYSPTEILSAKKTMAVKLSSLIKEFNSCSLDPCKSDTIFTKFAAISAKGEIEKVGIVTGGACASTSTASLYIPQAIKGKVKKVPITARDIQSEPYLHGGDVLKAKLGLVGNGEFDVKGTVQDNENGTYEVSITPQTTGEHQLDITIGNEHIQLSPFIISVREERPYTSQTCLQTYSISQPYGVAFSESGEMFVINYSGNCIQVMNKQQGNVLRTIGSGGSGNLQFSTPHDITIHGEMVYVTDYSNSRVQKFTTSGKFISTFGSYGSGDGQLNYPRGLCIDPDGKIYVSESSSNRISVFNADESFDRHITGNLSGPWGLAFDPSGNLHVANNGSGNIVVYTSEGKYSKTYGQGSVRSPAGIAIDCEGYVFVSEYYYRQYDYGRLIIFNPQFQALNVIPGSLYYGVGVALDADGYIYVCDYMNSRIMKY